MTTSAGAAAQKHDSPPPYVFIGSSSAASKLACRIQEKLGAGGDIIAQVWDQNLFALSSNVLDGLLRYVASFDFAAFLLSPDDLTVTPTDGGGEQPPGKPSPRDNVIFELGLFMGVRGRQRTFAIVTAKNKDSVKLPSDLDGYLVLLLDPDQLDDDAYLTRQIGTLRTRIKSEAARAALSILPSGALANGYFNNFLVPVYKHFSELEKVSIVDKEYQFDRDNYELVILLPRSLGDFSIEQRDSHVKSNDLLPYRFSQTTDKLSQIKREYGLFVHRPQPDGKMQFADYPTTLRASSEIIGVYLQEPGQVDVNEELSEMQKRMEAQEVANFHKALRRLLDKNNRTMPRFRDKIVFEYVD